ncbi:MAG: hypothetical protein GY940_46850, partial [bacterium]|nr:hypothetical protein [bacterium]
ETLQFLLEEKETAQLLTDVNRAFNTEINDILLTALGLGLAKTFNSLDRKVLIALEGHGREDIFPNTDMDTDVSRTVGWFTSVYPVLLDFSRQNDLGSQLVEIKETLHRVPHKGIGYGILKYLTNHEHKKDCQFHLKPQISFNYLGQFDEDVAQMTFKPAAESPGNAISLNARQEYELELSGMIAVNRLTFSISYNKKQFQKK